MSITKTTIIIATTAEESRTQLIQRAIQSCLNQIGSNVRLVVVVNGNRYCHKLNEWIKSLDFVDYHYLNEGNFPKAVAYGVLSVKTEFFCFLDDDDELTTSSISVRENVMLYDRNVDVVVGNGLRRYPDGRCEYFLNNSSVFESELDLVSHIIDDKVNWLASCGGLFRTKSFDNNFFLDYAKHIEWTYFAVKIALNFKVKFVHDTCFIINSTPNSLSKQESYVLGVYDSMVKLSEILYFTKYSNSMKLKAMESAHDVAHQAYRARSMSLFWSYHIKSILSVKTFFRYFLFTRYGFYIVFCK